MTASIKLAPSPAVRQNQPFKLPLIVAILLVIGCSPDSPLVGSEEVAATAETSVVQGQSTEPATPAEPVAQTYSQKLADALQKAAAAKDAVVDQLSSAGESGSQAASDSVAWATEMFNSLKDQGLTTADNTQQWLAKDWELAGAWEYRVEKLVSGPEVTAKLNELGRERWECIQVVHSQAGGMVTFYFKRPAKSYLNNLPMKDLMHLLPLMGSGGSDGQ